MSGGEESHMVRIMSIHKSKGLEFPVVFVAGMGKNLNQTDSTSQFVTHMDQMCIRDMYRRYTTLSGKNSVTGTSRW